MGQLRRGERALRQMIRDIELGGHQESLRSAQTVGYRAKRVGGTSGVRFRHALRSSVKFRHVMPV
jgi:hypothetical protein